MFTGIIESKGKINQIVENSEGLTLSFADIPVVTFSLESMLTVNFVL